MYHQANEYCPEESIWEVCLPNYERELVGTVYANDEMYTLRDVTSFGTCTVHDSITVPGFDPSNPFPWFPDFDNPFNSYFPDTGDEEPQPPADEADPDSETPPPGYHIW